MLRRTAFCLALIFGACGGDEAKPGDSKEAKAGDSNDAKAKLPPVDAKAVGDAVKAFEGIAADQHAVFAAMALSELEKARLPASLIEGLGALKSVAPDQRSLVMAKTIAENIKLLDKACDTDAAELMASIATTSPDDRHELVWNTCKLERHGLVTKAETVSSEPVATMVAHMIYMHLSDGGPSRTTRRCC